MFTQGSKSADDLGQIAPSDTGSTSGEPSVISTDLKIVGVNGQVEGSILAETITIFGIAVGPVQANKVRLGNTAQVVGNIFHNELKVEPGAHHEGRRPWRPNIERKPIFER